MEYGIDKQLFLKTFKVVKHKIENAEAALMLLVLTYIV